MKRSTVKIRGFLRGQIVDKDGKVVGDTGVVKNKFCNYGLQALACFAAAAAGSNKPIYGCIGTQNTAMDVTQTVLVGSSNAYRSIQASGTSGSTASFSGSHAGSDGSVSVGALALHSSNAAGGMWAGQTFSASNMATNQNFNWTYSLNFASA